jgi:hypothetical protein
MNCLHFYKNRKELQAVIMNCLYFYKDRKELQAVLVDYLLILD